MTRPPAPGWRSRLWPWLVLAASVVPAVWYVLDFESDVDPEFPRVVRPTFNAYPPPAYRFAEAGDTIDHVAVYVSSAALVLSAWGVARGPVRRLWLAALALSIAGFWHAATPGPLVDGWHGLGWRNLWNPAAPTGLRLALGAAACLLAVAAALGLSGISPSRAWEAAKGRGILGLLIAAGLLMIARQLSWIDREPFGFWPRWAYVWGLLAWALALVRVVPAAPPGWSRAAIVGGMVVASLSLDVTGRGLFRYQRPLQRLREIVPGRIYLSAMPTYEGLALAQQRHHFKTIINLFPEFTKERSERLPDELRFVRDHGLAYIGNEPTDDPTGEEFIARTLEVAKDPAAWPILVHCHASMDRSPAWVGLYRFAIQGWPLADAIREIEVHRGLRPKASVTLLYNRMIPRLAPDRASKDPTVSLLRQCAAGVPDPVAARSRLAGGPKDRPDDPPPPRR
ncbi:Tyrosine phosphatase family protein [Aquisphaera giovannonii]|uniref:Tyrosine phosphatase family protein n=1 Tax=Aquisphaera giovannonii TaxID=406548 RepID=A0A5B9W9E9_9BACT|nr:protein tyrosine phosphatase [Aquisphaera giovannonii]QEH37212.1 Tyrosine phosphatase family protein [Aquisphaera giovannonii]